MSKPRYHWWGYVRKMAWHYREPARDSIERKEKEAVRKALEKTARLPDGRQRVHLLEIVFFDKTHTLAGAAQAIPCSYGTAKNWQSAFFRQVAREFGLLEE